MKIKNWFTEEHEHHVVLYGDVYDDEEHKFVDGTSVRTSYIKDVNEESGNVFVKTCNNIYKLDESDLQEVKITYNDGQKNYEFVWK